MRRKSKTRRSLFEDKIEQKLNELGVGYEYEPCTYELTMTVTGHRCSVCESKRVVKTVRYTPDWLLANGVIIETKGKFTARDRKIALAMKQQHGISVKMLFQRDNYLSKLTKTRYSDWCKQHGVSYSIGKILPAWTRGAKRG